MESIDRINFFLKKFKIFLYINSFIKARILNINLRNLDRNYFVKKSRIKNYKYNEEKVCALIKENLNSRNLIINSSTSKRPNILFVGTNSFQDHSGIIQSLKNIGNVELIYKENGEYGFHSMNLNNQNKKYDDFTVKVNSQIVLNKVDKLIKEEKIDVLIGQMWANYISLQTLKKIRNMGIVVVNIAMDDMLPEHWKSKNGIKLGAIGLAPEVDLTLNTSKNKCEWYYVDGYPSIFWPLASNIETFSKRKKYERDIDVSFIGSKYGIRESLVNFLKKNGINIQAYGHFWPNGAISPEETAEVFQRTKIILGCGTIGHTDDVYTIKLRDFDAPISGAMYITHENEDLKELYEEEKEIIFYKNKYECLKKINFFLNEKNIREKIAAAGQSRAIKEHTWDLRFQELFSTINRLR